MSRRQLATYVHVADEHGKMHVFGPNDDKVPAWAASKITNPKAWKGGNAPTAEDPAAEAARLRARLAELEAAQKPAAGSDGPKPPPKSGQGSSKEAWAAYAAEHQVDVPEGATREQIWQALDEAKVPTE